MCFWQNREVFCIPGEKGHSILVAFLAGVRKGRKMVILAPFRHGFRKPAMQATVLVISHIRYTSIKILRGFLDKFHDVYVLTCYAVSLLTTWLATNCKPIHANGKTHHTCLPSWKLNHSYTLMSYFQNSENSSKKSTRFWKKINS